MTIEKQTRGQDVNAPMLFYPSYRKAIDCLQNDRERLKAYDMLTTYAFTGNMTNSALGLDGEALRIMFEMARPSIDAGRLSAGEGGERETG